MTQRHGTAVYIYLGRVQCQITYELGRNYRERLVDLKQIDIICRHADPGQCLLCCGYRLIQHQGRITAYCCHGDDSRAGLPAHFICIVLTTQDQGGGTIYHTGTVASMVHVVDVEVRVLARD